MWPDASTRQAVALSPISLCQVTLFLTYYFTINPRLFPLRFFLLPITLGSIWQLCTKYYFTDPWMSAFNFMSCVAGVAFSMKLIDIAMMVESPRYDGRMACEIPAVICWGCFLNTVSYICDMRCLHWHCESPCHRPRDSRPDGSHIQFYGSTLFHGFKHLIYFDTAQAFITNMGTHGTPQGDTIFRHTLALTRNHIIRVPHPMVTAVPLTLFGGLSVMNILEAGHYLLTFLAAPFVWLSGPPYSLPSSALKKEWPPLFDGPLEAMSVRDFWSHRWHALFRRNFLITGGKPGAAVGGYLGGLIDSTSPSVQPNDSLKQSPSFRKAGAQIGGVMGVFLVSGLMHDWGAWGIGRGTDYWNITGYFLLQGVAVILEEAIGLTKVKKPSARAGKISSNRTTMNGNAAVTHKSENYEPLTGPYYYIMKLWTFIWVVFPATLMIDSWLRRGITCVVIVPHSLSPARALIRVWNDFAYKM